MINRITRIARHFCFMAVTLMAVSITAFAQTDAARIQGTVSDSAGAVVTGATVTAKNLGNNREVSAISGDNGQYTLVGLSPARYQLTVALTGFKTVQQEVTLQIQQVAVINFSVDPGDVSEVVEVDADAPLVDAATSAVGDVVTGRRLIELPLNGRNFIEVARQIPGVTQGVRNGFATGINGNAETYRNGNTGGSSLSVNGQRTQANNFMIDGVDNNEALVNSVQAFPSMDAIEEYKVQTSIAPAEFGRGGGAIINTTMKSGKNRFAGSSYMFLRNDYFDANDPREGSLGRAKPEFRRGNFGATIGGPISFPKYGEKGFPMWSGKDKLFFFFSYEGLRQFRPRDLGTTSVPTVKMRNGDFSEILAGNNTSGVNVQLVDPANGGAPIAGNRLDLVMPNRINQAGLNYLRAFPLPNTNLTGVHSNYAWVMNEEVSADTFDGKIDWHINDNHVFNTRIHWSDWSQLATSRLADLPAGFGSGSNPSGTRALNIGLNSIFSPNISNELRVSASRMRYAYEPPMGDIPVSRNLGFIWSNPDPLRYGGVAIGAYGDGGIEYTGDGGAYTVPQNTYSISDSITWVTGKHVVKFGASVLRRQVNYFQGNRAKGEFGFWSGDNLSTRWVTADMLVGFAQYYWAGSSAGMVGTRSWENGFFIQDDWKVNKRLTLNLGLRYDILTMPTEAYGRQANFDLASGRILVADGAGDSLVDTDWGNFGPRAGFAYDITGRGRSVLRGGFGIFYYLDRGGVDNQLASNPPFRGAQQMGTWDGYRFTFTGQAPNNSTNPLEATAPLPTLPPSANIDLNNPGGGLNLLAILPDNKNSRTYQYDIQFQQELWKDTALSIGYFGNRGENLTTYYSPNSNVVGQPDRPRPYQNINVNVRDDIGRSTYDSLQAKLERRFTDGFQYLASYTYSRTKDVSNGAWDNPYGFADVDNVDLNFGRSIVDFPHVFNFSSIWEVPIGRDRKVGGNMSRVADAFIGGWQLAPIFRIQSGAPFDIRDPDGNLVDLVGDPYTGNHSPYLNWSAFRQVPTVSGTVGTIPSRIGDMERNSLRQPTSWSLNLGLSKNFKLTETAKIQFRTQAYNLFNTPQYRGLSTWLGGRDATQAPNEFGKWYEVHGQSARQIEFGLRLEF